MFQRVKPWEKTKGTARSGATRVLGRWQQPRGHGNGEKCQRWGARQRGSVSQGQGAGGRGRRAGRA